MDVSVEFHFDFGSTWTHELDLRAFLDRPWWNH